MGSSKRANHSSTARLLGDDEAGPAVTTDDELVEVGGLLSGETAQPEVIQDKQVGGEERAEGLLQGVVQSLKVSRKTGATRTSHKMSQDAGR